MGDSLVIGGRGFIGTNLVQYLTERGEQCTVVDDGSGLGGPRPLPENVKLIESHARNLHIESSRTIDSVFYMAARVGGITFNCFNQSLMLEENLDALLGLRLVYAMRPNCVVYFSTACVYPSEAPVPTTEEWGAKGLPEKTNFGYGVAKRTGEVLVRLLHEETGVNTVVVRPFNTYGPWDYFEPKYAHFIPALIYQMVRPTPLIRVFGGPQSRAFVYVDDIVRCVLKLAKAVKGIATVNVGHSNAVTIQETTEAIKLITGFKGTVKFIKGPIGYPKRAANSSFLEQLIGPVKWSSLEEGLGKTVKWYREWMRASLDGRAI